MKKISLVFAYIYIIPTLFIDITGQIYQFIYFNVHDIPKVKRSDYVKEVHQTVHTKNRGINGVLFRYVFGIMSWVKSLVCQTEIFSCAIKHWHPTFHQNHQKNFYSAKLFDNDPKNDPAGESGDEIVGKISTLIVQKDKKYKVRSMFLNLFSLIAISGMIIPIVFCDIGLSLMYHTYFTLSGLKHKVPRKKYIIIDRWKLPKLKWFHRYSCLYCEYANGLAAWAYDMTKLFGEEHGFLTK